MKRFLAILLVLVALSGALIFYAFLPTSSEYADKPYGERVHLEFKTASERTDLLAPRRIRLMTYNIGYASGDKNNKGAILTREEVQSNLSAMAEALKPLNLDVIGMQEVDFDADRTSRIDQLEYLQKELKMPYAAYVITWNKNYVPWPYWPPGRQFGRMLSGQAVLSRFPITDYDVSFFEKPEGNPFWYNWFYLERATQRLVVDLGDGHKGVVWNVHLEAFDAETRHQQGHQLGEQLKNEAERNLWLLGDLNSSSFMKEIAVENSHDMEDSPQALQALMMDSGLLNAERGERFYTMPSWDGNRKIDHILYHPSLILQEAGTIPGLTASDHLPVWAEFLVP